MAATSNDVNTRLTFRKSTDGDARYRSFDEDIFNEDTSHKCPTDVHRTPRARAVALREIVSGKTVVAPTLAPVLAKVVQGDFPELDEGNSPFEHLTPRETEILCLLAEGQSNKVIARNLGISDGTVKLRVKAILRKFNIHSRVEAAVLAVQHGLKNAQAGETASERTEN